MWRDFKLEAVRLGVVFVTHLKGLVNLPLHKEPVIDYTWINDKMPENRETYPGAGNRDRKP